MRALPPLQGRGIRSDWRRPAQRNAGAAGAVSPTMPDVPAFGFVRMRCSSRTSNSKASASRGLLAWTSDEPAQAASHTLLTTIPDRDPMTSLKAFFALVLCRLLGECHRPDAPARGQSKGNAWVHSSDSLAASVQQAVSVSRPWPLAAPSTVASSRRYRP